MGGTEKLLGISFSVLSLLFSSGSAIDTVVVNGKNPSQPGVLTNPTLLFDMNWKDQWVLAFAYEHGFGDGRVNNSANPFGPGVVVTHTQDVIHIQLSYLF